MNFFPVKSVLPSLGRSVVTAVTSTIFQRVEKEMQRMFKLALPRLPQITIAVQQQHFQAVFVRQELQYRSLP